MASVALEVIAEVEPEPECSTLTPLSAEDVLVEPSVTLVSPCEPLDELDRLDEPLVDASLVVAASSVSLLGVVSVATPASEADAAGPLVLLQAHAATTWPPHNTSTDANVVALKLHRGFMAISVRSPSST